MKYLLVILLSVNIYAQDKVLNEVLLTSTQVLFGVTSGLTEGYRLNEHYGSYTDLEKLNLNRKWHDYSTLRNATCLAVGIEIGYLNEKPLPIAIDVLTSAIIFWFINDGVMNKVRGFDWFYQADTRLNFFERFNKPEIKISLLIVAIIFKYIKLTYL